MNEIPKAGWYDDPFDRGFVRWWNGTSWTHKTLPIAAAAIPKETSEEPVLRPVVDKPEGDEWMKVFRQEAEPTSFPNAEDRRPQWIKDKVNEIRLKKERQVD
jgi:hypothetical protein